MATFAAEIVVSLRPLVNDPQGIVVREGLQHLGFDGVERVRVGKNIALDVTAADIDEARALVISMCERLLCNPVIEDYRIALREGAPA